MHSEELLLSLMLSLLLNLLLLSLLVCLLARLLLLNDTISKTFDNGQKKRKKHDYNQTIERKKHAHASAAAEATSLNRAHAPSASSQTAFLQAAHLFAAAAVLGAVAAVEAVGLRHQ